MLKSLCRLRLRRSFSTTSEVLDQATASTNPSVDVSYMRSRHRILAAGGMPPVEFEFERERAARRERFGRFGLKSGVPVEELFPTVEELEEEKALGLYRELNDVMREHTDLQAKKKIKEAARLAELEKNLKSYPQKLAKYEASLVKSEREKDAKELALEKRIREIQEYFGYWMDPKDPRFEVMLQQKEQEEKEGYSMAVESILEYAGESSNSCGYCNGSPRRSSKLGEKEEKKEEEARGSSESLGVWADTLSTSDYLKLLDRGWRRSGRYLYKPKNETTCCPQYTIRLDSTQFYLSRSQRRTLQQMNDFLETGKKPRCGIKEEQDQSKHQDSSEAHGSGDRSAKRAKLMEPVVHKERDPTRPVLKKKEIRRAKFEEKCRKRGFDVEVEREKRRVKEESRRRTIESYIIPAKPTDKHKLEVKLVALNSEEFESRAKESFELFVRYQSEVHKDFDKSQRGYRRFLCESPLRNTSRGRSSVELGSFHMWYLLDDKLVAVGVVDLLPKCLSAKYLFYNPDFAFLSLGTYTALREIALTKKLHEQSPDFLYYYMGYYIHSCPKMRYKAKFRPSELLCDQSFQWAPMEVCQKRIEESEKPNGFAAFLPDQPAPSPVPINRIKVLISERGPFMDYGMFLSMNPSFRPSDSFRRSLEDLSTKIGDDLLSVVFYFQNLRI
ncbi:unnamed protein product [Caenorhabditis auriculariae]|uniref:arginyltransferase n=1 Tax=Caenorhabditis auriculariae TaxID=2777116 RepID=A0A8S1GTY0_9PELO|nr:unnamed protein product [Caenorhabditis auriculariae]